MTAAISRTGGMAMDGWVDDRNTHLHFGDSRSEAGEVGVQFLQLNASII